MNYINILMAFIVTFMASFAFARDDCETIKNEITDYEFAFPIQNCKMNNNGEVTSLLIYDVNYTIDG